MMILFLRSCEKEWAKGHSQFRLHCSQLDREVPQTVPHRLGPEEPAKESSTGFSQGRSWSILEMQVSQQFCVIVPYALLFLVNI